MLSKFKVWWIRNLIINWWISKINQIIYYQFFFCTMSFLIYKICIQPEFGLQSMTSVYISILWSRSPQTSSITYSQTAAWPPSQSVKSTYENQSFLPRVTNDLDLQRNDQRGERPQVHCSTVCQKVQYQKPDPTITMVHFNDNKDPTTFTRLI